MFGFMTRSLMGLAGGKVVLAMEGGYNLEMIAESAEECVKVWSRDGRVKKSSPHSTWSLANLMFERLEWRNGFFIWRIWRFKMFWNCTLLVWFISILQALLTPGDTVDVRECRLSQEALEALPCHPAQETIQKVWSTKEDTTIRSPMPFIHRFNRFENEESFPTEYEFDNQREMFRWLPVTSCTGQCLRAESSRSVYPSSIGNLSMHSSR